MRWGRIAKVLGLGVLGLCVGAVGWVRQWNRCEETCTETLRKADEIADEGRLEEAIFTLDEADQRCDCMRFTEGDEPMEHAAMRYWLKRICAQEGKIEMAIDGEDAGPMLTGLLKHAPCR